jgi:hypothetical protein
VNELFHLLRGDPDAFVDADGYKTYLLESEQEFQAGPAKSCTGYGALNMSCRERRRIRSETAFSSSKEHQLDLRFFHASKTSFSRAAVR